MEDASEIRQFLGTPCQSLNQEIRTVVSILRGDAFSAATEQKGANNAGAQDQQLESVVVSSNLRRALETGAIGLWDRLDRSKERILIHSVTSLCVLFDVCSPLPLRELLVYTRVLQDLVMSSVDFG